MCIRDRTGRKGKMEAVMAKANMKIQLSASAEQVWKVITDNKNYGWRSDLDRIEAVSYTHLDVYKRQTHHRGA